MRIPDRIYGIENELGVVMQNADNSWHTVPSQYTKQLLRAGPNSVLPFLEVIRLWHSNGACTYIDTGEHPEYATPECRSIRDVVLYAKAGELMMNDIFSKLSADGSKLVLIKNNLGCDSHGEVDGHFGCHENYTMYRLNLEEVSKIKQFTPFLISRQIMDGAGWWQPDGTYLFSQRSISIQDEIGRTTTNNRPLVALRDTLNDTGHMRRLHIIPGDANILDIACFLKLGTMSLVIALVEAELTPQIQYSYPATTMKQIACNPDVTAPCETFTYGGKKLSAFDMQVIYYETVDRHLHGALFASEKIEAETAVTMMLWKQTLDALYNHDEKWMVGRLDHATKKYLAKRAIGTRNLSPSEMQEIRKNIDLMYHNITDRTLQQRMNARWPDRRLLTNKQIEKACYFPPSNTRAHIRGLFISSILGIADNVKSRIDWTMCKDGEMFSYDGEFTMTDPFASSDPHFSQFLIRCLALPHQKTFFHHPPCDD
ncbi:MAG: proteasome accessory factor PafA2 family protein [bacterium]|nr:proteasome accessory factor PafA2 family protein [bacterium]MDZ4285482.1 proteasome accessory factor PafA2 family protein [Candidatus Sungbacteria bacterium]